VLGDGKTARERVVPDRAAKTLRNLQLLMRFTRFFISQVGRTPSADGLEVGEWPLSMNMPPPAAPARW